MSKTHERPILFSAPMVRAILEGRKTQTRRVLKDPLTVRFAMFGVDREVELEELDAFGPCYSTMTPKGMTEIRGMWHDAAGEQRYGATFVRKLVEPRWRLWVRETWHYLGGDEYLYQQEPSAVRYKADGNLTLDPLLLDVRWRPSIYMPRWASRITLQVTEVRVERVQSITIDDAIAESAADYACSFSDPEKSRAWHKRATSRGLPYLVSYFSALWDDINAKRGFGWEANPWVWVVSFRRVPE